MINKTPSSGIRVEQTQANADSQARRYASLGVAFGLLFPIIATLLELAQNQLPLNLANAVAEQRTDILLWIIDTAPLFLGIFAWLAGRRQDALQKINDTLAAREKEITSINTDLEQRVTERMQALEERNSQMRATVFFARQIADIQDVSTLLSESVNLITQQFRPYHAAVFLLDDRNQYAILQAASSDEGRKMLRRGHRVDVGDQSVVGRVAEQGKLYNFTGSLFSGVTDPDMPRTRSQIALPLLIRGKVIGVLDVHSEQLQAFGQNEAEVLQLLADQIAVSIANARLLSESQAVAAQLAAITAQQTHTVWREHLKPKRLAYQFTPSGVRSISSGTHSEDKDELSVPLILRGQEIGRIGLRRKDQAQWAAADQDLAEKVAIQVALALENSRLLDETRERALQEQAVNEISARFSRSLDVDALLQTAARELGALPEVAEVSVFIGTDDGKDNKAMDR